MHTPPDSPTAGAAKRTPREPVGRITLPSAFPIAGPIDVAGDVLVAPPQRQPETPTKAIEMDVPTEYVDQVLKAFRGVGFDANDTGVTVDTDEGEETLTTLELSVASLQGPKTTPRPNDVLRVNGRVTISPRARVHCHIEAEGPVAVGAEAVVLGDIRTASTLRLDAAAAVEGDVDAEGDVEVAQGARARTIRSRGEVRVDTNGVAHKIRSRSVGLGASTG